jgi:hypothetical protein
MPLSLAAGGLWSLTRAATMWIAPAAVMKARTFTRAYQRFVAFQPLDGKRQTMIQRLDHHEDGQGGTPHLQ